MIRILIVEDELPIANLIRLSLSKAGYTCDCVYNGGAAADQIAAQSYDLILLDVMLPEVDGFTLDPSDLPHRQERRSRSGEGASAGGRGLYRKAL